MRGCLPDPEWMKKGMYHYAPSANVLELPQPLQWCSEDDKKHNEEVSCPNSACRHCTSKEFFSKPLFARYEIRKDEIEQAGIALAYVAYVEVVVTMVVLLLGMPCGIFKPLNHQLGTLSNVLAEDSQSVELAQLKKEIEDMKKAQATYNKALAHIDQQFSNKTDSVNLKKEKEVRNLLKKAKKDPEEIDRILEQELGIKRYE